MSKNLTQKVAYETIKNEVSFTEIFRAYFPSNHKESGNSICPFHDDKNPSFSIMKGDKAGYCHSPRCEAQQGESKSVNVFDLAMKEYGCNFDNAVEHLWNDFFKDKNRRTKRIDHSESDDDALSHSDKAKTYHDGFEDCDYEPTTSLLKCLKRRGIFDSINELLESKQVGLKGNIIYAPAYHYDKPDTFIGYQTINLGADKPKRYRNKGDFKQGLFVINRDDSKPVLLVESFIDGLSLLETLNNNFEIIVLFSASNIEKIIRLKDQLSKRDVICFLDNDKAGFSATHLLKVHLQNAVQVDWDHTDINLCKDVNDLLVENISAIRTMVENPIEIQELNKNDINHYERIEKMNEKHCVVRVGGKCLILNEEYDPENKSIDTTFSSVNDFHNWHQPNFVINGKNREVSISKIWFKSKLRRQYDRVVFDPSQVGHYGNYYNMWRGLAVEPEKADWRLFKHHLYVNISNKDKKVYNYLLDWMADCIQNPTKRPGVAIVLKGQQGTGKNVFVDTFGVLLGRHYLQVCQPNQLTGQFNLLLKDKLLVFCNEAIWGGDKKAEGVIKGMITDDNITVEPKGKEAFSITNHIRLIAASNNSWIIPAGLDERRFFCLEVSPKHRQDRDYFSKVIKQMHNDHGIQGMLYDLQRRDISGVDLAQYPRTQALHHQILESLNSSESFLMEMLFSGFNNPNYILPEWEETVKKKDLYDNYKEYCKGMNERYPKSQTHLFNLMKEWGLLDSNSPIGRITIQGNRPYVYNFNDLETCRAEVEKRMNFNIDWSQQ
jgi:5S rRNA maturation endonuclease (ribonuclease M5)